MKLKSKYNVGDIVIFYNENTNENEIGSIDKIEIKFSWEILQKTKYTISLRKINGTYTCNSKEVPEAYIYKKLNKRAFEKAYAEQCAKEIVKNETTK